jgi:hypothetical protein
MRLASVQCPQYVHKPSAVLLAHSEQAALLSHQKAIDNFHKAVEEAKIAKLLGRAKEIRVPTTSNSLHNDAQAPDPRHANTIASPGSSSVTWTTSLTSLYSQVTPVNIDAISHSQPATSLYSQVTPVNIDAINPSQPVTLQIPQAAPNKRVHNEAHGLLSDINNSHEDAQLNPKPKGMCTFLLNIQSLLYLLHLAKRLRREENPSKVEVINNNGAMIDNNGILINIDVQPLTIVATVESKTADLDHFFSQPFEHVGANGKVKKHRECKRCL